MHPAVYETLTKQPQLFEFIRENPIWYRYLSREPGMVLEIEKAAREYEGKTFSKRLEKLGSQAQMVHMLIQLAGAMKD
jgi:hypothetical protein